MKNKYEYFVVILGGGSAGLTVAKNLALFGLKMLLIEKNKLGEDCLHISCVPSKSFITAVNLYKSLEDENQKLELIKSYVKDKKAKIAVGDSKKSLNDLVINVEIGKPTFLNQNTTEINGRIVSFKNLVFAVGSRVNNIPLKGLEKSMYLDSDSFWDLNKIYKSVAIISCGAISLELGFALNSLGVEVHFINRDDYILKNFDIDVHTKFINKVESKKIYIVIQKQII